MFHLHITQTGANISEYLFCFVLSIRFSHSLVNETHIFSLDSINITFRTHDDPLSISVAWSVMVRSMQFILLVFGGQCAA
jgi:hypothetical protein